jgi:hypothetical protein
VAGAATARLAAFPLPVSALVDAFDGLFAVWLLAAPARLDHGPTLARVEALQKALAEALGGRTDTVSEAVPRRGMLLGGQTPTRTWAAWDPRRALRLPGSRNRAYGECGREVLLARADLSRRYTLEELEAAVAPKANGKKARKA